MTSHRSFRIEKNCDEGPQVVDVHIASSRLTFDEHRIIHNESELAFEVLVVRDQEGETYARVSITFIVSYKQAEFWLPFGFIIFVQVSIRSN